MTTARSDSFNYVIKMAKTIENDEKRFDFMRRQVNSVEDCMKDGPEKCQTIKSLVIWSLKEFIPKNYKSDPRMLDFWYLMGKYSVDIDLTQENQIFDPTEKEEKGEGGGLFGCQLTDKAVIKGNEKDCGGLKMKKRLSFADENQRGISKNTNPIAEAVENKRTSYYPELDDITLAGAHGKFSTDMFTSTPRRSVMPSDFAPLDLTEGTQFFDPTEKEKVEGGGLFGCQLTDKMKGNEKGVGLNIKKRLSFADENQQGVSKNTNPMAEAVENKRTSYYPELDDITLAGAHGKFSTDMFTSTPRRSVMPTDFDPLLDALHTNINAVFPLKLI